MKYEREELGFRPVTITLETQEEVDVLHALLGATPGRGANNLMYELYGKLNNISTSKFSDYWAGDIYNK